MIQARKGLGACGDCLAFTTDSDGNSICTGGYDSTGCSDTSGSSSTPTLFPYAGQPIVVNTTSPPAPASTSNVAGNAIINLLDKWTGIASNVIAPQQTLVRGPNGQLTITGPTGTLAQASGLTLPTSLGGSSMSWLLIAAVVGGGLLLFAKK